MQERIGIPEDLKIDSQEAGSNRSQTRDSLGQRQRLRRMNGRGGGEGQDSEGSGGQAAHLTV
ncbi:hypothetical protein ACH4CD_32595 [Streptomyces fungicidicus]|uniref:hypothetical protein n=1 Tax=Streptomyces fungicidicus TaxID=68203 RepID=UPI003789DAA0